MYEQPSSPSPVSAAREAALHAFHVTEDDLVANRLGRISVLQGQRMLRSATWNAVGATVAAVVLALAVYAVANKPLKPVQWILGVGLAGALAVTGLVVAARLRRSVAEGVVERHAGPVRIVRRGKAGFFIVLGDTSFRLPVSPTALQNGSTYALYVMPASKRVIAAEPLDG